MWLRNAIRQVLGRVVRQVLGRVVRQVLGRVVRRGARHAAHVITHVVPTCWLDDFEPLTGRLLYTT